MYDSIFRVIFEDGSAYAGGNLEYPGWNKFSAEKKIKILELNLPNQKDKITLDGYEMYNFFIGAKRLLNKSQAVICHMYGLGHRQGIVTSYRITLISDKDEKHKVGDVTVRKFPIGKEGIGRTATTGWKEGAC